MNLRTALLTFLVLAMFAAEMGRALAAAPVVSNVRSVQRAGTQLVDIDYDLAEPDKVTVAVSTNGGATYDLPANSFTGALGNGISPGMGKRITWNAGQDWPNNFSANVRFRVTAGDGTLSIGANGSGTLTFDARPTLASGWSTLGVGTSSVTFATSSALDEAVIANTSASAVSYALGMSATLPPSQNAIARWNVNGLWLQTRPAGVDYLVLMATLHNDTGANQSSLTITYDWDQKNPNP